MRRKDTLGPAKPIPTDWAWLDALIGPLDDDFVQAVNERPPEQERPGLDFFDRETE
jgi:antitoxin VapB